MSLQTYLQAAPKAELHLHLEGAIQPSTLLTLARRNNGALPARSEEGLRDWFQYRNFAHFIEIYVAITRCIRTVSDYELIVRDLGAELARQNCRYAEVTFSPSTHRWFGVKEVVWFEGLSRGRTQVLADHDVEINWIFDIVRNADPGTGPAKADYVTGVAIEGIEQGVVALGLGGSEAGYPPEPWAPWFERGRVAGLHSAPHAGEHDGPASVWGAIDALGAERIGHGVRAIEDERLVQRLVDRRISLEVSPTSNVRLGVYPTLEAHPLRRLHEAGVIVTVNSDDPPLFNTTLTGELLTLPGAFGMEIEAIDAILLNAVRESFVPLERKAALLEQYRTELDALKPEHLGEE